jgi:CDP-diacylglycerol---glycerol-3-phosphate 3-phosphatidyltransferase
MNQEEKKHCRLLPAIWIEKGSTLADRFSWILVRLKISPNTLSVFGLLAGIGACLSYAAWYPLLAAALIIFCGAFDVLDGKVAKNAHKRTIFGAILDSSLDRYSEFFIYTGLAYHLRRGWGLWLMFLAFCGSTMVSYTRARAEGLGIDCPVGIMQRAERLILLSLGTLVGAVLGVADSVILAVMLVIAAVSNFTAFQRIFYVRRFEKNRAYP